MDVAALVTQLGGIATVVDLLGRGCSERQLRSAVVTGSLSRNRKGWLAGPTASLDQAAAVLAGARLTCVSATSPYGLWTPPSRALHLGVPAHAHLHRGEGFAHWGSPAWRAHPAPVDPLDVVLRNVLKCCDYATAVAVLDSGLASGRISNRDVTRLSAVFPALPRDVDALSGSGSESIFRVRGRARGWPLPSQVAIAGLGRVDFRLGERALIEIDSRAWHDDKYETDHARDLVALRRGCLTVRPTYEHVMHEWQWLERVIDGIIARGEHTWGPQHRRDPACDGYSCNTPLN
jgi:very-short-patch-repair endonuclease